MFENELKNMLDMEILYVYMTLSYIFSQIFNEYHKLSPFIMDKTVIKKAARITSLRKYELGEEIEFWNGTKMKGVWNEVERMNQILKTKYNTQIIEE